MSILDEVQQSVDQLTPEQLKEQFLAMQERRAKQKAKQTARNADPEVKGKRLAYSKAYREKNPEKFKEQRKAYMQKPEVKERMKQYRQKRQAEEKALLAKAREMGLVADAPAAPSQPAQG
jgi:hypothetical protein